MRKIYCLLIASMLVLGACSDDDDNNNASNNQAVDAGGDATSDPSDGQDDTDGLAVLSITPSSGDAAGGDTVVIAGTGFEAGAKVFFGSAEAEATFVSSFEITATTPPGTGEVDVIVRNPDATEATLTGGFLYLHTEHALLVGWCNIQSPVGYIAWAGGESISVYGRVYVEGCSEAEAQCAEVRAEFGIGALDVDPSAEPAQWDWTAATYNPEHTADDNDEYLATATAPAAVGDYAYVYRFSVDAGSNWTYCDVDGVDAENPFSSERIGGLSVLEEPDPVDTVDIGWCNLQHPDSTSTTSGVATETIYGRVYSEGCTEGGAECAEITAELGYASAGSDPSADASVYTWTPATHNPGHTADDNGEYQSTLTSDAAGDFVYAYRFSGDAGATWTYCDLGGSADGFQADAQGVLTVAD